MKRLTICGFFRTYLQTIIIEGHLFSKKQINQMKKLLPSIFSPEGIVVLHFFLFRYFQITNSDVIAHLSILGKIPVLIL